MDVAATLVNYLDAATAIPWFHNAPKNAPEEYGTLTRDGGAYGDIVRDNPTVTLIVHAATRGRCATLANGVKRALIESKWALGSVFDCEVLGDYDDSLDGQHRHRVTATLVVND